MIKKYSSYPDRYGILKDYARENRNNMTMAESVLWSRIRRRQIGYSFLRQYVIGDYIVDFICRSKNFIIEVDGSYHAEPRQKEEDKIRQNWLEAIGYDVVRFTNDEILFNTDNVIKSIINKLK